MKKVLFVINSLEEKAGSERVACVLANLFSQKLKVDITIVNRSVDVENCSYPIMKEVKFICLSGNAFIFYNKLQRLINELEPNYLVVHNMGKLSILCSLLRLKNTKIISLEHISFLSKPSWIKLLSKYFYNKIHTIVTLTERDKEEYSWHKNVKKINNLSPYQNRYYQYNVSSKKIIAIGRLTHQKNFEDLVDAWKIVESRASDWNLDIYGKGQNEESLKNKIKDLKLINISLKGTTENMDIVYRNASFIVMSSRYEGLPMVLIEAQSFGLPIISFDCPFGPKEIISNNIDGYLIEHNVDTLAEKILKLINHLELREKFSNNAFKNSKRFSQDTIIIEWANLLNIDYDKSNFL
ncbi:hypothetical protein A4G19_08270 [Pasteurellaceae bacterium Macca]|nr:hypothetical protein [Pasteurellaceae bacterium Macca]